MTIFFRMAPSTPGNWWFYFNKNGKTAICKADNCNYSKDIGPSTSLFCLSSHLKTKHPEMYKKRQDYMNDEARKKEKSIEVNTLKRSFDLSNCQGNSEASASVDVLVPNSPELIVKALQACKRGIIKTFY